MTSQNKDDNTHTHVISEKQNHFLLFPHDAIWLRCALSVVFIFGVFLILLGLWGVKNDKKDVIPIFFATDENMDFDVDLVYLWCDGQDPAFAKRKEEWLAKLGKKPVKEAVSSNRFVQVDELKYALRSVEKYVPWVRHIYIVTDRQVPSWLNTRHPKITVVDHSKIIPKKYIPTFNSRAIESQLYKIPGLSEHFLYANDDMFFNRPVSKSFFFPERGKVNIRAEYLSINRVELYFKTLLYTTSLMERDFELNIPRFSDRFLGPHHNIDAYLKSDYKACAKHFEKEYTETLTHRFRTINDVQRFIVSFWSVVHNHGYLKMIHSHGKNIDSLYMDNNSNKLKRLLNRYQPALFCINDVGEQKDRERTAKFLKEWFPNKSQFEK